MMNAATEGGVPLSDMDNVLFLGSSNNLGGAEDSIPGTDLFFGSSPMVTDLDDTDIFQTSPEESNVNQVSAKDERHAQYDNRQSGSSPEEFSEDSSSDDSARHKRKSSSMSFQTSNDGDMFDHFKMWTDGPTLAPALSNHDVSHKIARDVGHEMSNEDMEIHFDFKSAASSPRPLTIHAQQAASSTLSLDQRQAETPARIPINSVGASPSASQSSTEITAGVHMPSRLTNGGDSSPKIRFSPPFTQRANFHERRVGNTLAAYDINSATSRVNRVICSTSPTGNCSRLVIHPIPQKSRVETQIPVKITLFPVPDGIKKLHLPTHTISKPKLIQRPKYEKSPDTLELYSMLVCTSAMQDPQKRAKAFATAAAKTREKEENESVMQPKPGPHDPDDTESPLNGGEVNICGGCITRERKRAARKKSKKPDEESAWANDEARRVVVFNTNEVRPWDEPEESSDMTDPESRGRSRPSLPDGAKQIKMPMRIACYCRHHSEKVGFQVILTIKDYKDGLVAQAMSQPIVITDDHKAQPPSTASPTSGMSLDGLTSWMNPDRPSLGPSSTHTGTTLQRNAFSSNDLQSFQQQVSQHEHSQVGFRPFASVQAMAFNVPSSNRPNKSRQTSPSSSGPISKKRKSSAGPKIPDSLVMTKSQLSPGPMSAVPPSTLGTNSHHQPNSATISPFTSHFPPQPPQQATQSQQRTPPYPSGPPTPDSSTNDFFSHLHRSQSFETSTAALPTFSQPPSTIPSRAPSPSSFVQTQVVQKNVPRANTGPSFAIPAQAQQRSAVINKVIPTQGPIAGGIEVTCLGSGFYQGVEVMFGDALATTTTYWGESTLVCLLPPADRPGQVPVTLKHQYEQILNGARHAVNASFTYIDGSEQDMLRQALVILGQKITGRVEDAGDIVRHVLPSNQGPNGWTTYRTSGGQHHQNLVQNLYFSSEASSEDIVIKCLELMDTEQGQHQQQIDLPCDNGQTLLHLAASLGYQRLVASLLVHGASVDVRDRNGFSPMHMASLRGHAHIVGRLRLAGGNPLLRSRLGFSPADLATTSDVIQSLRLLSYDGQRSYVDHSLISGPILHSERRRVTPPISRTHSATRYDAGDEWNDASSEEDEDSTTMISTEAHHSSRRSSIMVNDTVKKPASLMRMGENVTPAAALVLWRDQLAAQIQQFQQSVESLLSPLQMPTLPTIPPLPNLPSYQTPAMVRRISSFVPQRGSYPESLKNTEKNTKDTEHKWWDIFSSSQAPTNSPPAYTEIYPDTSGDLDSKTSTITSITRNGKDRYDLIENQTSADLSFCPQDELSDSGTYGKQSIRIDATTAQRKRLRSDRNLFFIWIPLLLLLITIALRDRIPNVWDDGFPLSWLFRRGSLERVARAT